MVLAFSAPGPACGNVSREGSALPSPVVTEQPPSSDDAAAQHAVLSSSDVVRIAELARLRLTDAEVEHYTAHLAQVLEHAADLDDVDLTGLPTTWQAVPLVNVLRADDVVEFAGRAAVLADAPDATDDQFEVPPILGDAP